MRILSVFDGMACGMLAMLESGIEVERYVAFEIDKYAIQTAVHNFPMIEERGDVFKADFTEFWGFDYLIGGSPCTYWSIAQKNNRETEASGMGWELFQQYVRALREAQPRFFIYENNKSMSKEIRASINETFGFEAVLINSALVSAQNRQRLYWVGKRNEDGTYSKVEVEQPEDRGILLKDILETGCPFRDKSYTVDANKKDNSGAEPVRIGGMPRPNGEISTSAGKRIYSCDGKGRYLCANGGGEGAKTGLYALPLIELSQEYFKGGFDGSVVGMIENESVYRNGKQPSQPYRVYSCEGKSRCVDQDSRRHYITPCPCYVRPIAWADNKPSKAISVTGGKTYTAYEVKNGQIAIKDRQFPIAWEDNKPTKAISVTDGKTYVVYEVKDGQITIKNKQYPIKLADGFYIIRKLTVRECMRLQTVPEWYEFPVSDTQALRQIGNGWTISVICHLLNATLAEPSRYRVEEEQLYFTEVF